MPPRNPGLYNEQVINVDSLSELVEGVLAAVPFISNMGYPASESEFYQAPLNCDRHLYDSPSTDVCFSLVTRSLLSRLRVFTVSWRVVIAQIIRLER